MAWWSPKSWFQKAPEPVPPPPQDPSVLVSRWLANDEDIAPAYDVPEPEPVLISPEPVITISDPPEEPASIPIPPLAAPEGPFCWAPLDPEHPHAGLSSFATDPIPPPGHVLCVLGLTPDVAASDFLGKVIAWERLTPPQENDLKHPPYGLRIDADALRLLFR